MGSWTNYFIESDKPEEGLEQLRAASETENSIGRITGEGNIFTSKNRVISEKDIAKCDLFDRLIVVKGSDTSDYVHGELYSLTEGRLDEIDREASAWGGGFQSRDLDENGSEELINAESYLESYFYRKHDFKIWSGRSKTVKDYEKTYNPHKNQSIAHICPVCESKDIKVDGWNARCKRCSYRNSKPWFEGHIGFREHTDHPQSQRIPSYNSTWRNKIASIELRFIDLKKNRKLYAKKVKRAITKSINKFTSFLLPTRLKAYLDRRNIDYNL